MVARDEGGHLALPRGYCCYLQSKKSFRGRYPKRGPRDRGGAKTIPTHGSRRKLTLAGNRGLIAQEITETNRTVDSRVDQTREKKKEMAKKAPIE